MSPLKAILKVFEIDTDNKRLKQKNKFQYTIQGDNLIAEVYATEEFTEKKLVIKATIHGLAVQAKEKNMSTLLLPPLFH